MVCYITCYITCCCAAKSTVTWSCPWSISAPPRPPGENPKTDSELRVINKKHISPVTKHISPVTTSFNVKLKKLYLL